MPLARTELADFKPAEAFDVVGRVLPLASSPAVCVPSVDISANGTPADRFPFKAPS